MKKTILFLAANPLNTNALQLDKEAREIEHGLRLAKNREDFSIETQWAVRIEDFRRSMLNYTPSIVHFSGHGAGIEGIILENNDRRPQLVAAEALQNFFSLFPSVECVILNACYSEPQANAIAKSVEFVIGMKKDIGDASAIEFSVAFYDSLGAGESMERAYKIACNALHLAGLPDYQTPILVMKQNLTSPSVTSDTENKDPNA